MDRRAFLGALGLLGVVPLAAGAQPTTRLVKIGVLCAGFCPFGGPEGSYRPLVDALGRVGLVPGRTLAWDIGGVVNAEAEIVAATQKLIARQPDLILIWPGNVAAARAAKAATNTIPIVLMAVPDAVEHALVGSLRRPGGNISGISVPTYDLTVKQLQILKEMSPRLRGIVVVQGEVERGERQTVERLRGAAPALQLDAGISVTGAATVEQVLTAAAASSSGVLVIGNIPIVLLRRIRVLALERKLPLLVPWRPWEGGGGSTLIAYGPRFTALAERTAIIIDRLIKGAKAGDLPVEEPTEYELIIDGVMAKALGLTIPPSLLQRADQVIE